MLKTSLVGFSCVHVLSEVFWLFLMIGGRRAGGNLVIHSGITSTTNFQTFRIQSISYTRLFSLSAIDWELIMVTADLIGALQEGSKLVSNRDDDMYDRLSNRWSIGEYCSMERIKSSVSITHTRETRPQSVCHSQKTNIILISAIIDGWWFLPAYALLHQPSRYFLIIFFWPDPRTKFMSIHPTLLSSLPSHIIDRRPRFWSVYKQ